MNTSFYGRLTRDPEIRTPKNGGNPYTTITVATQVRSKDGEGKNKSIFIDAIAFGKSGEILAQYFHKGSRIVVHGEINDIGAWIGNRDGQAHASVSINVTGFDFVDTKTENERQGQPPANTGYTAPAQPYGNAPAGQPYTAPPTPPAPPATGYTMPPGQPNAAPPAPSSAPAAPPYAQSNPYEAPF